MDGIDGMISNVLKSGFRDLLSYVFCSDTATTAGHARNIPCNPINDDKRRSWLKNAVAFAEQADSVI